MTFISMTGKPTIIAEIQIGHVFCERYMKAAYDVITCPKLFDNLDACAYCREMS